MRVHPSSTPLFSSLINALLQRAHMDEEADRTGPSVTAFVKAAEFFETNGRYQEAIDEPSIRNYIACATGAADGYLKLNDPRAAIPLAEAAPWPPERGSKSPRTVKAG